MHFTAFSRECPWRAIFFPQKPLMLNHKVHWSLLTCKNSFFDQFLRNWTKAWFLGILQYFYGHAQGRHFLPPKIIELNHERHWPRSPWEILELSDNYFVRKNINFCALQHFHGHAQGAPDFFHIKRLCKIIKPITLHHSNKN